MKKKLLIVALVAGLLPTLFSCNKHEKSRKFVEENTSIQKLEGYDIFDSYDSNIGISIDVVITSTDTVVIWSKYKSGSVIIDRKPINK